MTIATSTIHKLTFDEFLEQCPEDGRYELIDGEIVRILATRYHEDVADFLQEELQAQAKLLNLNLKVSGRIVLATFNEFGREQARHPDVSVVNLAVWRSNRSAYTAFREPIQIAIEVVSSNWEDDYIDKLEEYQSLGISEYWIVDYLGLASRKYLGNPKAPSIFVNLLDANGQYQSTRFQGIEPILSPSFPELNLTMAQILSV